jgi:signal transduction histidine kinase
LTTRSFRGSVAQSRPRDSKGGGLGLAIVREVCERSSWVLTVSRVPQGGLRVVIDFCAASSPRL